MICNTKYEQHRGIKNTKPLTNDGGEKIQSTEDTLKQRGSRYGKFENHAELSQGLQATFWNHVDEHNDIELFNATTREAINVIFHKLARIGNGDPKYDDNFRDISGYSELVVKHLNGEGI